VSQGRLVHTVTARVHRLGWGRRTVLISLRCDDAGTELLTWALVKAALMGKSVVVVHVTVTVGEMAAEEGP